MAYATIDDMLLALGESVVRAIGDFTGDIVADDPHILAALEEASSLADSFLGGTVTVLPVPPILRRVTVDLAAYMLCVGRDMVTTQRKEAFDDAIAWLRAIAKGEIDPGWITYPTAPEDVALAPGDPLVSGMPAIWPDPRARSIF